jgi:hypothetical protein
MSNDKESTGARKHGPNGRFLPGNKAGRGRPKGSRNKTTLMVEALLEGQARELTQALIRRAKEGYGVALQLVFDRLAPVRRGRHIEVDLPPINTTADVILAQAAIIRSVAAGELSVEDGDCMVSLLEIRRRIVKEAEIRARLDSINNRFNDRFLKIEA